MLDRFWQFIKMILIGLVTSGGIMALGLVFMTELDVRCDLQDDQFYTCQARDTVLGRTLSEVKAKDVYEVDYDLKCSGSGSERGCSAHAQFKTAGGDLIIISKWYTDSDQVRKVVDALKSLLAEKATPIDITFTRPPFLMIILTSAASCVFVIILLVAILSLFARESSGNRPITLIRWKKN